VKYHLALPLVIGLTSAFTMARSIAQAPPNTLPLRIGADQADGNVFRAFSLRSPHPRPVKVRVNGESRSLTPEKN